LALVGTRELTLVKVVNAPATAAFGDGNRDARKRAEKVLSPRKTIIERALELARSGSCRTIREIRRQLVREDYDDVDAHLHGAVIRQDIMRAVGEAAAAGRGGETWRHIAARRRARPAISGASAVTTRCM
jgi:hypothetical protein